MTANTTIFLYVRVVFDIKDSKNDFKVKHFSFKFLCQNGMMVLTAQVCFWVKRWGDFITQHLGLCSLIQAECFNFETGSWDRNIPAFSGYIFIVFQPFSESVLQNRNLCSDFFFLNIPLIDRMLEKNKKKKGHWGTLYYEVACRAGFLQSSSFHGPKDVGQRGFLEAQKTSRATWKCLY